jgi:hypothetical protein
MPPGQIASTVLIHADGDRREGVLGGLQAIAWWRQAGPGSIGSGQNPVQKMAGNHLGGQRARYPLLDRVTMIQQLMGVITALVGVPDQR